MITNHGPGIWTLSGPEIVFAGAPMHTRATVVQLADQRLWVHSPVALTAEIERFIESLTEGLDYAVCALVAPNKFHHMWVREWRERFPDATVFAEAGLQAKVAELADAQTLTNAPPALYASEIEQILFDGVRMFQEAVFFHKPSRSLIMTDLMINQHTEHMPFLARCFMAFEGVVYPNGGIPRLYRWLTTDKARARACAAKILAWAPERLLFCHGEAFSEDAETVLRREFVYLLGNPEGGQRD